MDPAYCFHRINVHLMADLLNDAAVVVEVHESENGVNWCRCPVGRKTIVPGGEIDWSVSHNNRYVRVVLWSSGNGIVTGVRVIPEAQTLPGYPATPVAVEETGDPTVTISPLSTQQCIVGYTFRAELDWTSWEYCEPQTKIGGGFWPLPPCVTVYPDLDLYVRDVNADEVVYYDNLAGGGLTLNHDSWPPCHLPEDPPEVTTGTFTAANSFYVWWAQRTFFCAPPSEPDVKRITVTNTGTCPLSVNGTVLLAAEVYTLDDFLYAGYGGGDMSEWLGGTPIAVP